MPKSSIENPNAMAPQFVQRGQSRCALTQQDALGDFKLEPARRKAATDKVVSSALKRWVTNKKRFAYPQAYHA